MTARLAGPDVRQPIDARYFTLEDGRWLNSGNNRFETVEEAVQRFADICARREDRAAPAPAADAGQQSKPKPGADAARSGDPSAVTAEADDDVLQTAQKMDDAVRNMLRQAAGRARFVVRGEDERIVLVYDFYVDGPRMRWGQYSRAVDEERKGHRPCPHGAAGL